jgi:uncharacterized membrane protein
MDLKKRVRNYGFWTALIALIPMVATACGVEVFPDKYTAAANALLAFFVAAGIVNDPTTDNNGFSDDKE